MFNLHLEQTLDLFLENIHHPINQILILFVKIFQVDSILKAFQGIDSGFVIRDSARVSSKFLSTTKITKYS